jgi:hypothetical protein
VLAASQPPPREARLQPLLHAPQKELFSGALWLTASLPFLNRVRRHRG